MTSRLRPLERADAARLAALITGYRAAMGAGASATSEPEARRLIASAEADANILMIGAEAGAGLAGFALAFDLAEIVSGGRAGQLDDLFVAPEARGAGLARALDRPVDRGRRSARLDTSALAGPPGQHRRKAALRDARRARTLGQLPHHAG
ncbi:GNAT family N-acetyltransferase [Cereibacter changlensis]|uniref:GNAT family N-acetyltransferase n=1 Tax=Cereibacter changlensis TaxID=402884 RepID=UPI00215973DC|nr:GNAT family N-acetyltransferase [Cereibacter changlensis]